MAISITPEVHDSFERFQKSLHTVQYLKSAFTSAPPSVDAEPYQYLISEAVDALSMHFDAICSALGFPN